MATITLTETDRPSRSKQAGPCWVSVNGTYASATGRTIEVEDQAVVEVHAKCCVRRATRTETEHRSWTVLATGNPANTVHVSLGSPQAVEATLTGVVRVDD